MDVKAQLSSIVIELTRLSDDVKRLEKRLAEEERIRHLLYERLAKRNDKEQ